MKLTTKQLRQMIKEEMVNLKENWTPPDDDPPLTPCQELEIRRQNMNWKEQELANEFMYMSESSYEWMANDLWAAAKGDQGIRSYYRSYSDEELMNAARFLDDWHDAGCGDKWVAEDGDSE